MTTPPLKHMSLDERIYHRIKARFAETVNPSHLMVHLTLPIADEVGVFRIVFDRFKGALS